MRGQIPLLAGSAVLQLLHDLVDTEASRFLAGWIFMERIEELSDKSLLQRYRVRRALQERFPRSCRGRS